MKKIILALCLLVFIQTSQSQTKEETVDYINKLVSEAKPSTKKFVWSDGVTVTLSSPEQQSFSDNQFICIYRVKIVGQDYEGNEEVTKSTYSPINYKYLLDSFKIEKWDELYSELKVPFSQKIFWHYNGMVDKEHSEIRLIIPTDKVNNVKRALLHLRDLALKEKDLFDN